MRVRIDQRNRELAQSCVRIVIWLWLLCAVLGLFSGQSHGQTVAPYITSQLQFTDNNAKPLASGCVFTYAAGTTTNQATYTDSTGSVQNQNPIILNAGGFPPSGIWLSNLSYKFKVMSFGGVNCALGNLIRTEDNLTENNFISALKTNPTAGQTVAGDFPLTLNGSLTAKRIEGIRECDHSGFANTAACISDAGSTGGAMFPPGYTVGAFSNSNSIPILDLSRVDWKTTVDARDFGVKCDGVADNQAALQAAFNAAGALGLQRVALPPGTCLINTATTEFIYDGTWVYGAGPFATTIKRGGNWASGTALFSIAGGGGYGTTGNVTFSDFAIDGNKAVQTLRAGLIAAGSISKMRMYRMRFLNSSGDGIGLFPTGTNNVSDILIADSDFENNSIDATQGHCDLRLLQPLRVRVMRNRFLGSLGTASICFSSNNGVGQVEVGENTFAGFTGFAIALGGGATNNAVGANLHDNYIDGTSSNQNLIDIAAWSKVQVHHNLFPATGTFAAIGDLPPATEVEVDGNVINATNGGNQNACIGLGGSNLIVANNFCQGAGASGIAIAIANTGPTKHVVVSNNIVKNSNRNTPGNNKAGIELFIAAGGTGALGDVTIKGNHAYDDQGSPTQKYGLAIANSGQTTGFSNITVEGNDFRGNVTAAILNNATSPTGFNIRNNDGDTTVGLCNSSASPAVCGVAPLGTVAIANPATTLVVNTTAVTANSVITVFEDSGLGARLGVTCNTTTGRTYTVSARTAGTSFTITASATPAANSACLNYRIDY